MNELDEIVGQIRANADLVVEVAREQLSTEVGFDRDGVVWLDGYVQRQFEQGDPAQHDALVGTLGSFLGQCLVECLGGEWEDIEGFWAIRFDEENAAFPFTKVAKHLSSGAEDSVLAYFDGAVTLFGTVP